MKNKIILGAGLAACALAWAAKDPIIMTVNGVDVPKSEFEYLYNKNAQQQMTSQPIDEYVEMFKNYKLKVADAHAMGIDTMPGFVAEMEQYRKELAAPYLVDSTLLNRLVDEQYARMQNEVETSHIMIFKTRDYHTDKASQATLDSLRQVILKGGDFAALAAQYSQDRGSMAKGGSMGYITAGRFPYNFEKAAYELKPGEISKVVESPMGYHLVKTGNRRPARGEVLTAHIMRMVPPGSTPEQDAKAKAEADSICQIVKADPSRFAALATELSQDPGSAQKGGQLPWFGTGQMVREFEEVAFNLPVGEISEPIRSQYGYHIIQKIDRRDVPSKDKLKPALLQRIQNPQDERSLVIRDSRINRLAKKHHAKVNNKVMDMIRNEIRTNGLDSAFYDKYENPALASVQLASVGKHTMTMGGLMPYMRKLMQEDGNGAAESFNERFANYYDATLIEAEEDWLEDNVAEYRNLLHEYHDGSMLYEASVTNVWNRAAKDEEGLKNYFDNHREDYTWSEPRVKGLLVQAKTDSVAALVKQRLLSLGGDTIANTLRKEFKGDVKVDRVLVPKGANAMIDNLLFNGKDVTPSGGFADFFLAEYKIIDAPEEYADVRPQLTTDYQNLLEREWVEEMRAKYPVEVYEKVLKTVKPISNK